MIKKLFPVLLFFCQYASAQIIPNNTATPTAVNLILPPAAHNSSAKINYVRSWEPWRPIIDPLSVPLQLVSDVKQTTSFIDGLGRAIQTVTKQISPLQKDLVVAKTMDIYGKEVQQYLPYVSPGIDGYFKTDAFAEQQNYFSLPSLNNSQYIGEQVFYSSTVFENSPLGRPESNLAPGNSWGGANRGTKVQYLNYNALEDKVQIWNVTDVTDAMASYNTPATYNNNQLYKTLTTDENEQKTIEYKDKEGRVVLKKVQLSNTPGNDHTGWFCTYYIYDIYGLLRAVIQPRGVELLTVNGWQMTSDILNEFTFRYEYDKRNRLKIKKVPGAGEVWMVYDVKDRLVMLQDINMRNVKWLVTQYDNLDRIVATGFLTTTSGRTFYETQFLSPAYNVSISEELTRTYYDDYSYIGVKNFTNVDIGKLVSGNNPWPETVSKSIRTYGLVTGNKIQKLGTNQYLTTSIYYDEKGRVIQILADNINGGIDVTSTRYDFNGKLICSYLKHNNPVSVASTTTILTKMEYDHAGRLKKLWKQLNDNGTDVQILENSYDELGQLKSKKIAPAYNGNVGLEVLNNEYNIRGWLLGVNKTYAKGGSNTNFFGYEMNYDHGFSKNQYNGNISGITWRSKGDGEIRAFGYDYDNVNRLLKADFTQYTASVWNNNAGVNFSIGGDPITGGSMKYDANGNITEMWQKGLKVGSSDFIDKLSYSYGNKNSLDKVTDNYTAADNGKLGDFKDGNNGTAADYSYDLNGNMNKDLNKSISSITYNYLNLPAIINVTGKGTITYSYDAAGNKLKKVSSDNTVSGKTILTTTEYIAGFVYESKQTTPANIPNDDYSNRLQFMGQEEGRIRALYNNTALPNNITGFAFDYMIKDHLGNVRMVLTDEVKQNTYPAATLEGTYDASTNSMVNYEKGFYKIDPSKIISETAIASWNTPTVESVANTRLYYNNNGNPPANINYPSGCAPVQTDGSTKLYKLNATTNRTGLEFMIKVMAGDKIDIFGKSYFLNTATVNNSNSTPLDLAALMANLLLTPANAAAGKGITSAQLTTINTGQVPTSFFRGTNGETTTIPKAYINYIFLDEQFKFAGGNFSRVGSTGIVKDHWYADAIQLQNLTVPKNGYIFVYVSNESNLDVFFDNLQVIHKPGPILEETHYYPFGLTMSGISSKAAGMVENKKKYNGIEFENDLDLNVYDAQFRELDAQTGRWWQIDPKTDEMYMWSTYASNFDNPIRYEDPLGDEPDEQCCGEWLNKVWSGVKERVSEYTSSEGLMSLAFPVASLTNSLVNDPKGTVAGIGQTVYNGSLFGTVNNAVNNPKELGKSFVDAAAVVVTEKVVGAATGTPKGTVDLYRGVNESSPAYGKAVKGEVQPRGGNATPAEHNAGNTKSNYSSWTTDPAVAKNYSLRPGGNGVVLKTTVPKSTTVKSPSLKSVNLKQSPGTVVNESEVLLKGRVKAKVQ